MNRTQLSAFVGLGGNSGSVADTFLLACAALDAMPGIHVAQMSGVLETRPVSAESDSPSPQPAYVNAVARLETTLAPLDLLDALQAVELQFGRIRRERWGARTLDLDLLFFGGQILDLPRLTLPHPAAWYRRFVLDPLVEIAPDAIHPVKLVTIRELQSRLLHQPAKICFAGGDPALTLSAIHTLRSEFPTILFEPWAPGGEVTFIVWLGESSDPEFSRLPLVPRVQPYGPASDPVGFVRVLIASASL